MNSIKGLVLLALASCSVPPRGQVLVYVDTDAPLVALSHALSDPVPLFDRLELEILGPGSDVPCGSCTKDIEVQSDDFAAHRVSFGVVPPPGQTGYRVRVRLYHRAFALANGEPEAETTIDVEAPLPVTSETGIVEATLDLATDDVGRGPVARTMRAGPPGESRVGRWPGAARTDCAGDPQPGEACVPGGAVWLGPPRDERLPNTSSSWHRLAILSPFWIATTEMTVAAFRAAGGSTFFRWTGLEGGAYDDYCTFTTAPVPRGKGSSDDLPLDCVPWQTARDFCRAAGGDLPTESQLEYLLGGLHGARYAWGEESPQCWDDGAMSYDVIWGRNGAPGIQYANFPSRCYDEDALLKKAFLRDGGPEPPALRALDRIALRGGTIVDIAGNLSEWVRDNSPRDDPCWSAPILRDPVCDDPNADRGYRGGSWTSPLYDLQAWSRHAVPQRSYSIFTGFRCVRPGR